MIGLSSQKSGRALMALAKDFWKNAPLGGYNGFAPWRAANFEKKKISNENYDNIRTTFLYMNSF